MLERINQNEITLPGLDEVLMLTRPKVADIVQLSLIDSGIVNNLGFPLQKEITLQGLAILYTNLNSCLGLVLKKEVNHLPPGYTVEVLQTSDELISGLGFASSEIESGFLIVEFNGTSPVVAKIISTADGKKHTGQSGATKITFGYPPVMHIVPTQTLFMHPGVPYGIA